MRPPPVVMIHGAFCGGWAFERFRAPFEAAGHAVSAPDLPGHGADDPPGAAAGLSMRDYADAAARAVAAEAEPPVLVGHSMGGLAALMAAAQAPTRGLALLAPSAPWGVGGSSVEEAVSALGLYALGPYWAGVVEPDYDVFRRYAGDRLADAERRAVHARMRPESGRAMFETLNWWLDPFMTTLARPERIGAPILALAGERDPIHPPATVRAAARRIGAEFDVLPQMGHWLVGEPGWEAVAERCLDWIASLDARRAAAQ